MASKKKRRVTNERSKRHTIEVGPDDLVVVVSSRKIKTADGAKAVTPPLTKIMIGDQQVGLVSNFEMRASTTEGFSASARFLSAEVAAVMSPGLRKSLVRNLGLVSRCWFVEVLGTAGRQEPT